MSIEILREAVTVHKKLAQERTILANERNTLAYIRTGFSAFLLGFGLIEFLEGFTSLSRMPRPVRAGMNGRNK